MFGNIKYDIIVLYIDCMKIESREKKFLKQGAEQPSSFDTIHDIPEGHVEGIESTLDELQKSNELLEKEKHAEQIQQASIASAPIPTPQSVPTSTLKSEQLQKIEHILEEDMDYIFEALPQHLQKEFQEQGEDTARNIEKLLSKARVNVKKVVGLIVRWLKIIPGINKFFLEQEAKIKADKIVQELTNTPK